MFRKKKLLRQQAGNVLKDIITNILVLRKHPLKHLAIKSVLQ